jgi:hypothetical protein
VKYALVVVTSMLVADSAHAAPKAPAAPAAPAAKATPESAAILRAQQYMIARQPGADRDCHAYAVAESGARHAIEIEIREARGKGCPGDPKEKDLPVVDRVRVHDGGALEAFDAKAKAWGAPSGLDQGSVTLPCQDAFGDFLEARLFVVRGQALSPDLARLVEPGYAAGATVYASVTHDRKPSGSLAIIAPGDAAAQKKVMAWVKSTTTSSTLTALPQGKRCAFLRGQ